MTTRAHTGGRGLLRRMGAGFAVLALAVGMAATAAGPAGATAPQPTSAPNQRPAILAGNVGTVHPSAAATTTVGSIVYISGNNVWLMAPDGTGKKQITHDGTAASPYFSPSETDSGTIVALRTTSSIYGTVYVMNRVGSLVHKFTPAQFTAAGTVSCPVPYVTFPDSLTRAIVSPDGVHLAYTAAGYIQNGSCTVGSQLESFVINTDGTGAKLIDGGSPREVGTWINNTQVWLSDNNYGSIGMYRLTLPSSTSSLVLADNDLYGDAAYYDPSQGGSTIATGGWSFNGDSNVVRLWNSSNVSQRCEIDATAGQSEGVNGQAYAWPISMSPLGTGVTWWEVNGSVSQDTSDEGVYVATFPAGGCPSGKTLLASGGSFPFWGSAAVNAPSAPNTAPVVTVTAKPAIYVRSTSASISYKVSDTTDFSVSTTCTLDAKAVSCVSPKSVSALAQGRHTFVITATDPEGAKGSATVSWTVDTGLPTVSVTVPAAVTVGTGVVFRWGGSDAVSGVAGYDVEYTTASYIGSFGTWVAKYVGTTATSWTLSGLKSGYEYCVRVRTHDKAGNVSAYSPARCTTHPMDDRALRSSSYWTKPTLTAAYLHTESDAAHLGATLTLAGARVAHIAVLATVTTVGGSVAVYVGATKIGSVNLKASAGRYQQVLWLPTVSLRSGTLTLKTLSAAAVRIDGLVDMRTP